MGRPFAKFAELPSQEVLKSLFDYDETTGQLLWRPRHVSEFSHGRKHTPEHQAALWTSRYAGRPVGNRQGNYLKAWVRGTQHLVHRLIWKWHYGEAPDYIDHIDGDTFNNRIENLRSVTHAVNMKNKSLYKNNTSGIAGVYYHERDKVWCASIGIDGQPVQIGTYKTQKDAAIARTAAEFVLNYHKNHGRPKKEFEDGFPHFSATGSAA